MLFHFHHCHFVSSVREGLGVHMYPKSWHCQKGGGIFSKTQHVLYICAINEGSGLLHWVIEKLKRLRAGRWRAGVVLKIWYEQMQLNKAVSSFDGFRCVIKILILHLAGWPTEASVNIYVGFHPLSGCLRKSSTNYGRMCVRTTWFPRKWEASGKWLLSISILNLL